MSAGSSDDNISTEKNRQIRFGVTETPVVGTRYTAGTDKMKGKNYGKVCRNKR
jgi:hypothetical protein